MIMNEKEGVAGERSSSKTTTKVLVPPDSSALINSEYSRTTTSSWEDNIKKEVHDQTRCNLLQHK